MPTSARVSYEGKRRPRLGRRPGLWRGVGARCLSDWLTSKLPKGSVSGLHPVVLAPGLRVPWTLWHYWPDSKPLPSGMGASFQVVPGAGLFICWRPSAIRDITQCNHPNERRRSESMNYQNRHFNFGNGQRVDEITNSRSHQRPGNEDDNRPS